MFTGIIENLGKIIAIEKEGTNVHFTIESNWNNELKIDQSVAHNGVCLTVTEINEQKYKVTAVAETLIKTNLNDWKVGDTINLERAMLLGARLDGHIVQGHVDTVGVCYKKEMLDGSSLFTFSFPENFAALIIEKGSICINGVSLTAFNCLKNQLTVTIIPYTLEHTNFKYLKEGQTVNLEFDVLGKYILRSQDLKKMNNA